MVLNTYTHSVWIMQFITVKSISHILVCELVFESVCVCECTYVYLEVCVPVCVCGRVRVFGHVCVCVWAYECVLHSCALDHGKQTDYTDMHHSVAFAV